MTRTFAQVECGSLNGKNSLNESIRTLYMPLHDALSIFAVTAVLIRLKLKLNIQSWKTQPNFTQSSHTAF